MSILGLCLIVLGTILSFFGTYLSDKQSQEELTSKIQEKNETIDEINQNNIKLIDQNASLLASNNDVSNTNRELIEKNTSMLSRIDNYQATIEERNKKILELESEVNHVKEFGYYANLDMYGRPVAYANGLTYKSELTDLMSKVLFSKDGKTHVKRDLANLKFLDEVIAKYPNFPFGYYVKSDILKFADDILWKVTANQAIKIFEITTTIEGHNKMHDEALKVLRNELAISN